MHKAELKKNIIRVLDDRGPTTRRTLHLHLEVKISPQHISQLLQELKRHGDIATRGHGPGAVWFRVTLEGKLTEGYRGPHKKTYKELYDEQREKNRTIMDHVTRLKEAARQDAQDAYNWRTLMAFLKLQLQQQTANEIPFG